MPKSPGKFNLKLIPWLILSINFWSIVSCWAINLCTKGKLYFKIGIDRSDHKSYQAWASGLAD